MKITQTQPVATTKIVALQCDRCRTRHDHVIEMQEYLQIDTRAGYASVFGDQNHVELDLCQKCTKEVLGPWIRISER